MEIENKISTNNNMKEILKKHEDIALNKSDPHISIKIQKIII